MEKKNFTEIGNKLGVKMREKKNTHGKKKKEINASKKWRNIIEN